MGGEAPTLGTGLGGEPGLSLSLKAPFHMGAPQQLGLLFWKWKGNNPGALLV